MPQQPWSLPSGGGSAELVTLYSCDYTAQGTRDLLAAPWTDTSGTTWSTADQTILGAADASAIGFIAGEGLAFTSVNNNPVSVGQLLSTLAGDYDLSNFDRLLLSADIDTSGIAEEFNYIIFGYGDRAFTGGNQVQISRNYLYPDDSSLLTGRRIGGTLTKDTVGLLGSPVDGLLLDLDDAGIVGYYRETYSTPVPALTGWTRTKRAGWWASPTEAQTRYAQLSDGTSWVSIAGSKNQGTADLTVKIRSMTLQGWAPSWR